LSSVFSTTKQENNQLWSLETQELTKPNKKHAKKPEEKEKKQQDNQNPPTKTNKEKKNKIKWHYFLAIFLGSFSVFWSPEPDSSPSPTIEDDTTRAFVPPTERELCSPVTWPPDMAGWVYSVAPCEFWVSVSFSISLLFSITRLMCLCQRYFHGDRERERERDSLLL